MGSAPRRRSRIAPHSPFAPLNVSAPRRLSLALALFALAGAPACSFRSFQRETDTTGRFRTEAISFRFLLFFEVPWNPKLRAMDLARDSWGDNLLVTRYISYPDLGILHWLNGLIIGWRGSVVEGEYGIPPNTPEGREAFENVLKAREPWRELDGSPSTPLEGVKK